MSASTASLTLPDHVACRILVCDDSCADSAYLAGLLKTSGYCAVTTLTDPRQALALIAQGRFDLVLLDIMMPCDDGLEIIKSLRQSHSAAELPVLVITSADSTETRNAALAAGANDYLTKPVDPFEMSLRTDRKSVV